MFDITLIYISKKMVKIISISTIKIRFLVFRFKFYNKNRRHLMKIIINADKKP